MTDEQPDESPGGDWSLGGRGSMDDMARTLSTFGTRLDALVTSTTSYRSAITDRLVEYADTVNRLVKNQSVDLAEHRSANQRLLDEVQAGVASSESSLRTLADRLDEMVASSGDGASQELLTEIRTVLDAQERLGQFLTDALDQFGDRVVERLDAAESSAGLAQIPAALAAVQEADLAIERSLATLSADVQTLRDSLVELASGDVVGALWDEVRALRTIIDELRNARSAGDEPSQRLRGTLDDIQAEMAGLRADLIDGFVVEADESMSDHLQEMLSRLVEVQTAVVEAHAAVDDVHTAVDDVHTAVASAARSGRADAAPDMRVIEGLEATRDEVAAIAARLDEGLEIDIADDGGVVDRVAALRDEVTTELEAVRLLLADLLDRPEAPTASVADDELAGIRAELDALQAIPDVVAEAINDELVALRRRIKVRSEADVLTDDQLDRIAAAVAERLV